MSKPRDAFSEAPKTLRMPSSRAVPCRKGAREGSAPLSPGEFAVAMDRLGPFPAGETLALALSGGADSLSLLLLLKNWVPDKGLKLIALHVHHALRSESYSESQWVKELCQGLDVPCRVLSWRNRPPKTNQKEARKGRYDLLQDYLLSQDIAYLLTAHHADDQLETHLMRRDHGSGDWGGAGMSARRAMPWGWILRPLLSFEKARLYKTLLAQEQPWIEDPSNQSDHYKRTRYRRQLSALSLWQNQALRKRVRLLGEKRALYEKALRESLKLALEVTPWGKASFNLQLFKSHWTLCFGTIKGEEEAAAQALCLVLHAFGGGEYSPRIQQVQCLMASLEKGRIEGAKSRLACRTLARCQVTMTTAGHLEIIREARGLEDGKINKALRAVAPSLSRVALWDGRFVIKEISPRHQCDRAQVAPCGLVPDCSVTGSLALFGKRPPLQVSRLLPKSMERNYAQKVAGCDPVIFVPRKLWATLPIILKEGAAFGWPAWDEKGCRLAFLCCEEDEIIAEGAFFVKKNLYQAVFKVA